MLPLGILYFTLAASFVIVSLSLALAPLALLPGVHLNVWLFGIDIPAQAPWLLPVLSVVGVLLLFVTLHMARGIGRLHGVFAKNLTIGRAHVCTPVPNAHIVCRLQFEIHTHHNKTPNI